jgi:DNA-binding IclR family transcriptional regulator
VHRLLAALESHELIGHNEETGRYHLGLRLFSFGTRAVVRVKLREVVAPYLLRLMRGTEETVHLAILEGSEGWRKCSSKNPSALSTRRWRCWGKRS